MEEQNPKQNNSGRSEQSLADNFADNQNIPSDAKAESRGAERNTEGAQKKTKKLKIKKSFEQGLNARLDEFKIKTGSGADEVIDLAKRTYLKNIKSKQHQEFLELLKLVAPGTQLRTAIDSILRARTGALIVLGENKDVQSIIEGGFRINCKFTPQRLAELSKMDGAVILSKDLSRIVYANTQLIPDPMIPTKETGTRHKAAERTSKQINRPVIAISQKKRTVSFYYGSIKYVLRVAHELLSRAAENIQIIEKQRTILDDLITNLNVLEFTNLVSLNDISAVIQRVELIMKLASAIKRYIIELGVEGNLVKMQLRELIKDIEKQEVLILQDYVKDSQKTKKALSILTFEDLLETSNIIKILLENIPHSDEQSTEHLIPKGYRILNKTSLGDKNIDETLVKVENFQTLLELPQEQLAKIFGDKKAKILYKEIFHLKEQIMLGKKI